MTFAEGNRDIFHNKLLTEIGKKYQKTAAQIILRWLRQSGIIAIPKSVHAERIKQNFEIGDFQLANEDMEAISKLDDKKALILDINSLNEVTRLYNIRFQQ